MSFKLGLPASSVRIMNLNTGGAFCGRGADKPHHYIAALLSRKAGKPVKIRCSADEEFIVYHGGGTYNFTLKTGVMKDGAIKAIETDLLLDCGADVNYEDGTGDTALFVELIHSGRCHDDPTIVRMLLDAGAEVNVPHKALGMTPVECATLWGRTNVAGVLGEYGATTNAP